MYCDRVEAPYITTPPNSRPEVKWYLMSYGSEAMSRGGHSTVRAADGSVYICSGVMISIQLLIHYISE